jgi:hypothetical protein
VSRRASLLAGLVFAQAAVLSEGQVPAAPPVADSVPAAPATDSIEQFESRYRAVGSPRILLFWNVSFDDETRSTEASIDVTQTVQGQSNNGPAEVHGAFNTTYDAAKYHPQIAPREAALLESAFRQRLHHSGVRLIDRTAGVRFEAAEKDRDGVDPKLIESDAVRSKGDILLEIVMVTDLNSPLGRGFKVTATRVATTEEITSLYTLAQPPPPPRRGRYVGTDEGFKWQAPPPWVPPVDQVGQTLAQEVMAALARSLTPETARMREGKPRAATEINRPADQTAN